MGFDGLVVVVAKWKKFVYMGIVGYLMDVLSRGVVVTWREYRASSQW